MNPGFSPQAKGEEAPMPGPPAVEEPFGKGLAQVGLRQSGGERLIACVGLAEAWTPAPISLLASPVSHFTWLESCFHSRTFRRPIAHSLQDALTVLLAESHAALPHQSSLGASAQRDQIFAA